MATYSDPLVEHYIPCIKYAGGYKSNLDMSIGDGATVTLPSTTTIGGSAVVALGDITSSSTTASAFTVTNTGIFTGAKVVGFIADSLTTGTNVLITTNGQTSGHALTVSSTGTIVTTGDLVAITGNTATTCTGLLRISGTGLTDGWVAQLTSGGANLTASGGVLDLEMGAAIAGTAVKIVTTGVYVGTTGLISVTANSATTGTLAVYAANAITTGTVLSISSSSASQTSAKYISLVQTGVATGFTGSVLSISGTSTTGSGNMVGVTGANTTAGDVMKLVNNAITVGTGTILNVSHTTSILGAGTSMVRISSTGADTGTTTGVLLDLSTTAAAGSTQVLLTDSSADTGARIGIYSKITNTAAVLAKPIQTSNVAVVNSKFTKHFASTDGTKTVVIWLSQDNTDPNGTLTGVKGDICLNSVGGFIAVCTANGTSWTTMS